MFARLSLCSLVAALGLLGPAYGAPTRDPAIRRRDADFLSVKTKNKQDHSGKGGDPVEKYFHESTVSPNAADCTAIVPDADPPSSTRTMTAALPRRPCHTTTASPT